MAGSSLRRDVLLATAFGLGWPALGLVALALGEDRLASAWMSFGFFTAPAAAIWLAGKRRWYPQGIRRFYAAQIALRRERDPMRRVRALLDHAGAAAVSGDVIAVNASVDGCDVRVAASNRPGIFTAEVTGGFDSSLWISAHAGSDEQVRTGDSAFDSVLCCGAGDVALCALSPAARESARVFAPGKLRVEFGQVRAEFREAEELHRLVSFARELAARAPKLTTLVDVVRNDPDPGVRRATLLRLIAAHRATADTHEACEAAVAGSDAVAASAAAIVLGRDPPPVDPGAIEAASHALAPKERGALLELLSRAGAGAGQLALADAPAADAGALSIPAEGGELSMTKAAKKQPT